MNLKNVSYTLLRYFILLILGLSNLFLFYYIFTPLTVYPSFWILSLFSNAVLSHPNILNINNQIIEIIPACVAGAAYYFLLLLNLTTSMSLKKRINSLLFIFLTFLAINILRISSFALLYVNGFSYFDLAHKTTWYFGSTILLILIWLLNIKIFKIKSIPIYTDFNNIYEDMKAKNKKSRKGK